MGENSNKAMQIGQNEIEERVMRYLNRPLSAKLRELRGLPADAPENDLYDTHPGVVQLTGPWTRTALELARVGNEMLTAKDAELAASAKMLGLEYDEIFDQLQMAKRKLDAREFELAVANRELSELHATLAQTQAERSET